MAVTAGASEKEFQSLIVDYAELKQWLTYHTHDSRRSAPGFPDLVLVRPPRLIFAEIKSAKGRVRPDQHIWLDTLSEVTNLEVFLWRPADWDAIQAVLA